MLSCARRLWVATSVSLLPLLAAAAAAPAPVEVDRELQALKAEAIQLSRDLQAAERAMLYPEQSLASVYVAVKVSGFLLDSISVRINEASPVTHDYTNSEALAFLKDGGWHRLAQLRLEPGTYRLQAEFRGHFHDARPGEPPVTGKVETLFEKGPAELDLVLPISRNTRLDKPGLSDLSQLDARKLRPARNVWMPQPERVGLVAGKDKAGGPNDPRYRSALFLRNDHRYLSALVELLDIQQSATGPLPVAFLQLLAECYLGFGMDGKAGAIYQDIASGEHDSLTLARARLQLAQFDYQRGRLDDAIARLKAMRERLPGSLRDDWQLLIANALLAQARYADVAQLLEEEGLDASTPVLRYNFGVALIRAGKVAEGREQLDDVGTMDVTNLEQLVLRDKANLTLGYQYLQQQRGAAARNVFGRIRTSGPFSNRALLGLGWAEIAQEPKEDEEEEEEEEEDAAAPGQDVATPAAGADEDSLGTMLRPGYAQPAGARLGVEGAVAKPSTLPQSEQDALRRALVAWVELVKRDPMDPAVQEGMLAIPWALDRLQAYAQSLARYESAIAALETARTRMNDAIRSIRSSVMVNTILRRDPDSERGWMWKVRDLPNVPETFFLQSLLAEHRFQEALKLLRDARMVGGRLDTAKKRIAQLERGGPGGPIENQLAHLRRGWQPAWAGTAIWLAYATELSAPGSFDTPLSDAAPPPMELLATRAPDTFEGRAERLYPLRARIDTLRPRLAAIASVQDDALEAISIKELEGQRATIERYLTEARFAVARIYDRQAQQTAP